MRILVISDQPLTVFALRTVLQQCDPAAAVDGAASLAEAMTLLAVNGSSIELILFDIDMPESRRLHGAPLLHQMWPDISLAVVSAIEPDDDVVRSINIGAMGYLVKTAGAQTLMEALRQIMAGGLYLPEIGPERLGLGA